MHTIFFIFLIICYYNFARLAFKEFWPDLVIVGEHGPYMKRWYLTPWSGWGRGNTRLWAKAIRLLPNIYLHHFVHDDPDRALHDHPWASLSIILTGGYREMFRGGRLLERSAGSITCRGASTAHRVILYRDDAGGGFQRLRPAWTLFFTLSKIRDWGFWCPKGWVPWWEFTKPGKPGEIGKGCGE